MSKFSKHLLVDDMTLSASMIDNAHSELHDGHHFFVSDYATGINNAAPKNWYLNIPAGPVLMHFIPLFGCSAGGVWQLFEGPTITVNGTGLTIFNSNRNSSVASTALAYKDPTVTVDGTQLWAEYAGVAGAGPLRAPGEGRATDEIDLQYSTKYVLRFTPDGNGITASMKLTWYVHPHA